VDDGHPILIVTAADIAAILRHNAIDSANVNQWLDVVDAKYGIMNLYYQKLSKALNGK
jgi:hypothetical protein